MDVLKSGLNRVDIVGLPDHGKGEKRGISVCRCKAWGWILERIFHIAVSVQTNQGTIYLNSKSLAHWLNRVKPNHFSSENLHKITHNSKVVQKTIGKLLCPDSSPVTLKAPIGLPNIGNSCYLNAVLQVLFHIPEISDLILKEGNKPFIGQLKNIFERKSAKESIPLMGILRDEIFRLATGNCFWVDGPVDRKFAQQDAHEAFTFIAEILKWFPMVIGSRMKLGQISHVVDKSAANHLSNVIIQDQKEPLDLQSVISNYFLEEHIEADVVQVIDGIRYCSDQWRKNLQVCSFPNYCVIQLGRYADGQTKTTTPITVKESIGLPKGEEKMDYEVIGYVNHHGKSMRFGHYTAHLKVNDSAGKSVWFHCDDSVITQQNPPQASKDVYLIVLKKKTHFS